MIVTTPDARVAFSMMRPVTEPAERPTAARSVEGPAPRMVRHALSLGLAGATVLLVVLAR